MNQEIEIKHLETVDLPNNTKKIKLTLYYVIIRIANFKQCICAYYNKACSITSSNGACNK